MLTEFLRRPSPVVLLVALAACGGAPPPQVTNGECVVLLHGLARSSLSMELMASGLEQAGYRVANIDYPSRDHEIETLAPMAVEAGIRRCDEDRASERIHFVGHSLGGILVRYYFADRPFERMGRLVMLGPPNQGSSAVDTLGDVPGFEWLNGPAGYQLGKGEDSVPLKLGPPSFEVGVIAGTRSIDPVTSAVLEDPDDGRVSVSDTRLEGMRDFRVIPATHAFMMQKGDVIRMTQNFLEHGSFDDPAGR